MRGAPGMDNNMPRMYAGSSVEAEGLHILRSTDPFLRKQKKKKKAKGGYKSRAYHAEPSLGPTGPATAASVALTTSVQRQFAPSIFVSSLPSSLENWIIIGILPVGPAEGGAERTTHDKLNKMENSLSSKRRSV